MPFPNEHSARIKNPGQFDRFARQNDELGPGIDVIFGIKDENGRGVSSIQAIRFDKKKFTVAQAKEWLKDHDFKAIEFEPAIEEEETQEASHGMATNEDGSCPAGYPVKRRNSESGEMRCFKQASARENEHEAPKSSLGLDVQGAFAALKEMGRKFTQEEANFVQQAPSPDVVCGACRFYLRDPESEIGQCQVVEGPIPWSATSDLYISAMDEARATFAGDNAYMEDETKGPDDPDLVEALERMEFNSFFVIEGGVAKDMGNKAPGDLVTTRNNAWAIVLKDREAGTNKATAFLSTDATGAQSRARREAERTQDPKMVVILGKKVGHLRDTDTAVFKDRDGYRYVMDDVEEAVRQLQEGPILGAYIRRQREKKGISLAELGRKFKMAPSTVGQVETGRIKRPPDDCLGMIANALGLSKRRLIMMRDRESGEK